MEKINKRLKNKEKGITLIALVITIVILLILASVSIAMLTGNNGILTQAKLAKENTQAAKEDEENKLANTNEYINEQLGNAAAGEIVSETKKDNYVDGNGDKATVPAGFTVSKIAEEQKVSEGLVIYDIPKSEIENVDWTTKNGDGAYNVQTLYNQFVWIPVASEEEYQRNSSYSSYYWVGETFTFLETTPKGSTTADIEYLPSDIQPEVDDATHNETAERKAVLKYNGFYISRYETGIENSKPVCKQNVTVYIDVKQTNFKNIGKMIYGNSSTYVKSAMCSGIQWDMVMKFIDGKKDGNGNVYDVRTYNSTRHTKVKTEAGKNLADKVQNIYDLEGNCFEYVAEKNNASYPFVSRGGDYSYNGGYRASGRLNNEGNAHGYCTFRSVIYIK